MRALFVILAVKVAQSAPTLPSFRNSRLTDSGSNSADSYGPPSQQDGPPSGPYPPSGWTPIGDLLLVPGETHSSQQNSYGQPPPPLGNEYGPVGTTTETPITTPETNLDPDASEGDPQIGNPSDENGQYFVLLPNGKLQKVQYSGKQRGRGQYEAQVQYEEVEPARAPVYPYSNLPFQLPFPF